MRTLAATCALAAAALSGCGGPAPADPLIYWDYAPKAGDAGGTGMGTSSSGGGNPSASSSGSSSGAAGSSSGTSSGAGSSSGGGSSSSGGSRSSADAGSGTVPCDVATVLAAKCTGCHSDPPVNGSLSGLVTYADLRATSIEDPTRDEAQLAVVRMQSTTSPMPPASLNDPATASDIATLQNWISAGYPSGSCGADAGPPPSGAVNVFATAPAFTSLVSGSSHNAGRDCMGCHASAGGEAPQFAFGGTLYDGNGIGVAGAEVRIVDATGKATSVYTGPEGNFHGSGALTTPMHAGARNAAGTALMVSALTYGGCNKCHCTGTTCATAPLHLP